MKLPKGTPSFDQEGGPIGLSLRKSPSLMEELELILTQEKQLERHQELLAYQPV